MLYTNQDFSLIFPDNSPPSTSMLIDSHTILEGTKTKDGFLITSLRSTNLKQYLDNRFDPGKIISL